MASMIRHEGFAPSIDGDVFERNFLPDARGLAAFRLDDNQDHSRSLSALIESEIIPRLMVAHAPATPATAPTESNSCLDAAEVAAFAPLVMQVEADALLGHVESILGRGVAFETVLVDLLAPTARLLGEFWEEDRCDFVDVTMGLWRLQEVVHEITSRLPAEPLPRAGSRRALFATMPGDQHGFGTVVIEEMFRRDGWLTDRLGDAEPADLLKRAADDWFDIIGLTVSSERHIGGLTSLIAALRNISRNPRVGIMVGGRLFSEDPDLAVHVGADGTARDAKLALQIADELVSERERGAAACN